MNLAFVTSHYGIERIEPLEVYCRKTAENLYKRGLDVTIYTETDGKKEGEYILNGVLIKRFKDFLHLLLKEEGKYDGIVFFGMVPAILKKAENFRKRKIIVPYLYEVHENKELLSKTLSKFDGIVFMTEMEKLLLPLEFERKEIIELWVEIRTKIDPLNFRKRNFILSDYILSFVDEKNFRGIYENFKILKRIFPFLTLIMTGQFSRNIPFELDIKFMDLRDEKDRLECIKGSLFTLFPSKKDSFDYFFLESMGLGVPIVVDEINKTLVDYCLKSNGGLWYSGREEFVEVASILVKDKFLRNGMGRKAQKYVKESLSSERIFLKWKEFLNSII